MVLPDTIQTRTVTVMLGGTSSEREVSLRTGVGVARALRSLGHTVLEVDPQAAEWTIPRETEVVFLALHGTHGEDGTVQEQLERLGIPYTGCGPEASRIAFDKAQSKQRFLAAGIPTPRSTILTSPQQERPEGWKLPLVLKPVCQGSSVGLQFVERAEDWNAALADVFQYDQRVLLEEKIDGRETTVGILDDQILPIVEIRPKAGAYNYRNKYTPGATDYLCPAPIDPEVAQRIQTIARLAFRAVGGRDYGRIDIMLAASGTPYVLEVNTLPGMTETSLLPKAALAAGVAYPALCQRMIDLALKRAKRPD